MGMIMLEFDMEDNKLGEILPATHPHSVKVCSILKQLLDALHRDLGLDEPPIVTYYGSPRSKVLGPKQTLGITDLSFEQIGSKIRGWRTDARHLKGLKWKVLVVDDPEYSAYTMGSGNIVLHTGLLDRHCDVGIATVLAHEVGHGVARHAAERIDFDVILERTCLGKFIDLDQRSEYVDRRNEFEADYIGLQLMVSAGYDPHAILQVYKNMESNTEDDEKTLVLWKERTQRLSQPHVIEEACATYNRTKGRE